MLVVGCTTSSGPGTDGRWQAAGLADTSITVLRPDGNGLLVGTAQGLFRWTENQVTNLGLNERNIRGLARFDGSRMLAGAPKSRTDFNDITLFKSKNNGESWEPFPNNFGGKDGPTWIQEGPTAFRPFSDTLFAQGAASRTIGRSTDGGRSWEAVLGRWDSNDGSGELLHVDPWHQGRIWAGGVTSLSQPALWKSTDVGETWESLGTSLLGPEAVAYDVMTHREDSGQVLVGLSGAFTSANNVRKSTDGGERYWTRPGCSPLPAAFATPK